MERQRSRSPEESPQTALVIGAVGVVFGDIATSPLYALRVPFTGDHALDPALSGNVLGILSLVFWSLMLVVGGKYALLIMRAGNKGEGGIMALMSLVLRVVGDDARRRHWVVTIGLLGTALFLGDTVIVPAISVMSAMEGVAVAAPGFDGLILPLTLGILVGLFMIQHRGTEFIGFLFSPIMISWLLVISALGLYHIFKAPEIIQALNPVHGLRLLLVAKSQAIFVLGSVVLVVTGAEALYADMGHFGARSIRLAWYLLVFPALLLNYLGQGALLLREPAAASNPFYLMGPAWSLIPLLGLATLATIIASQAAISGAFSLARQAMNLGYLPRLQIQHTSKRRAGQIYVPAVNWALAAMVLALVFGFESSSRLAAAYGLAVTVTMVVTTFLAFGIPGRIMRGRYRLANLVLGFFLVIDLSFFTANSFKLLQGGWVTLLIGGLLFTLLTTWKRGRETLIRSLHDRATPIEEIVSRLDMDAIRRVSGTAVYLTGARFGAPITLLRNLKINKVLHECVIILTVVTRDEPWVPLSERIKIRHFGGNIYRIRVYYGYQQEPDVPDALSFCNAHGLVIDPTETSFFVARENMIASLGKGMSRWREQLFIRMAVNAASPKGFWHIPPDQVVELGVMVEL